MDKQSIERKAADTSQTGVNNVESKEDEMPLPSEQKTIPVESKKNEKKEEPEDISKKRFSEDYKANFLDVRE